MDVVQLWQLDILKCVHTFHNKSWDDAKKLLAESYDLIATKENPLPHSWMRVDIKLGVSFYKVLTNLIRLFKSN